MGLPFMEGMPSGDTPEKVRQYYLYLQGHQETMQRAATWHVRWLDLAWLWGFLIALVLAILLWVWQYRTTRQMSSTERRSPKFSIAVPGQPCRMR
jgi:hypothetical protein